MALGLPRADGGKPRIWDAVEARYRDDKLWEDLVELYLERLEDTSEPGERAELLKRIGEVLRDGLDDASQAFDAFVEALSLKPGDGDIVQAAEELARTLGRWPELLEAGKKGAELETNAQRKVEHLEHLARWLKYDLDQPERAAEYLARVRQLDPSRAIVQRTMASVYRETGAFDAQREALERALVRAKTDDERKEIVLSLAELHETKLADIGAAELHYRALLDIDPKMQRALAGLARIYRQGDRFAELEAILERQIDAAADEAARVSALLRLAELHERHFVRPQLAAPLLEKALAIDPENGAALEALERSYHALRDWDALARTMERGVGLLDTTKEKVDLVLRVAEVLESKLGEEDAAFEACRRASLLDEGDARPVAELARLSERAGDWVTASTYRARLADLNPNAHAKAQIHVAAGQLLAAPERNPTRARMHFERAVVFDPANTTAWEALETLAKGAGDDRSALFCLERRASNTEAPRVRAQLFVELARRRAASADEDGALEAYGLAIEADPLNEIAAAVMLDHLVESLRWAEAAPLCDHLVSAATRDGDADRAFELLRLATRIATELRDDERAMVAALAAFKLNERDVEAREELLEVAHRVRTEAPSIGRLVEAIDQIAEEPFALSPRALVRLGDLMRALGDDESAIDTYRHALSLEADNRAALGGMADAFIARGDWQHACTCKERLAGVARTEDDRFALLVETAELWLHGARDLAQAAEMFERALLVRSRDHWLLHTLLSVYSQLERWPDVVRILRSIVDVQEDEPRKAKSYFAMAQVVRDKVDDAARAAKLFEQALDLDPTRLDAFEHVVRIHTELRDWEALGQAYVRMIERAERHGTLELLHALHHQLGLVYRDRMGDADAALTAFSTARALKPEDDQGRRIVAELYVLTDQLDMAIAETKKSVDADPLAPAPYHELYALFLRQHAYDKAWCTADALTVLGNANAEQARFLADYPPHALPNVPGTICAGAWGSHLSHPELDGVLTAIFAIMTPAVVRAKLAALPVLEQRARLGEPVDATGGRLEHLAVRAVHDASEILGHPAPIVCRKPGTQALEVGLALGPTMVVSPEVVGSMAPGMLAFLAGKRLAEQRPALLARALFPSETELSLILQTAIRITRGAAPGAQRERGRSGNVLSSGFDHALRQAMSAEELTELRRAVAALFRPGATADLARWSQLADATTTRAGLLLAGSLVTARKGILLEKQHPSDLPPRERLKDLLLFALSDQYSDLRGAIGVSVESTMQG